MLQAYKNFSKKPIEAKYVFPLDDMAAGMYTCVCMRVCMCVSVRACACVCVCVKNFLHNKGNHVGFMNLLFQ